MYWIIYLDQGKQLQVELYLRRPLEDTDLLMYYDNALTWAESEPVQGRLL